MGIDACLQRLQLGFISHLLNTLNPRYLHQCRDNLRQPDRHRLQRIGDFVGFGVVDLKCARHLALLFKRNNNQRADPPVHVLGIFIADRNFPAADGLLRLFADNLVRFGIIFLPNADIGADVAGIGNGDRVGPDILLDNLTDDAQRLGIDVAEIRQCLVGNVQRQLGLLRGNPFLLPLHTLHEHDNEADTDLPDNHRKSDLRNDVRAKRCRIRHHQDQHHGQCFAGHSGQNAGNPAPFRRSAAVNHA
ncbi:hypothetical protein D3C81_1443050 [compost metagenome]